MFGDTVRKAGEGIGNAVGGPGAGLAESAFGYLLSPWALLVLAGLFVAIRAIR
ncbi:MAG TPA: hypothetical protein VMM59_01180 [Thermohalobaculum sp.]|nr:hypothetical protein [Thermohalobaculum sp.]